MANKLKIGIVGCGLNSDYHINFSRAYEQSDIVGIVDKDIEKARECAGRFGIKGVYTSIAELVEAKKPDIIHIVTPPMTHVKLATEAMEAGCNVLLEKPMTLNAGDAEKLYALAEKKGVRLCTIHNHLFDPCMRRVDELVRSGELGDVINVESYYGLNTNIPAFRGYLAPNVIPWLYNLPGSVYQDFMPHALYVALDYTGKPEEIKVMSSSQGVLPQGMPDEIRVLIRGEKAFANVTISFAAKPHLHCIRVYGTKMMAEVDINTMTSVLHPLSSLPKAAQKATYNLLTAKQLTTSTFSNVFRFVTKKLKPYQGMKELIGLYYDSILQGGEPPVTKNQALAVMKTMDEIFSQLPLKPLDFSPIPAAKSAAKGKKGPKVLVTGGTGFLGGKIVETLVNENYTVRVLARKLSRIEKLKKLGVEIYFGDVADSDSLKEALKGMDAVIHAAAGTSGDKKDCDTATIMGTKNILALCGKKKIKKLIYISSCGVYGVADYDVNSVVTEDFPLEKKPELRGDYSSSKQEAEALVLEAVKKGDVNAVVLRPGTIYGPGGDVYTPMLGFSAKGKAYIVIGNGTFELPIVHVDNIADIVVKSISCDKVDGRVFNVVDDERITKRIYMKKLMKEINPGARAFYFPYFMLSNIVHMQEILCRVLKRGPFLTRYRLISSQKKIRYDSSRIREALEWSPKITFEEAIPAIVEFEKSRNG